MLNYSWIIFDAYIPYNIAVFWGLQNPYIQNKKALA